MLRRPPSSIALTATDVVWHLQRIKQQESVYQDISLEDTLQERLALIPRDGEEVGSEDAVNTRPIRVACPNRDDAIHGASTFSKFFDADKPSDGIYDGSAEIAVIASSTPSSPIDVHSTAPVQISESDTEDHYLPALLGPSLLPSVESHRPCYRPSPRASSYPSSHYFDFGGFLETLSSNSSPVSQEAPTPHGTPSSAIRRLRTRVSLLAPPSFQSDAASNSEERRLTTGFTPTVTYFGNSGLWLLQPPRRSKVYRQRTLSYSFVESERASGTYGNHHPLDYDDSTSELDLRSYRKAHEAIRRNSIQISNQSAEVRSSPPDIHGGQRSRSVASIGEQEGESRRVSFCSLPLRVPSTFSTASCCLLEALLLPQYPEIESRSRSHSRNPPELGLGQFERIPKVTESFDGVKPEDHIYSSTRTLPDSEILPIQTSIRSLPPRCPWPSPATPAPPPELHGSSPHLISSPSYMSQRIRVYDDRVSAFVQPQTPQNLPEDRHRSRFHPSYTAPVLRQDEAAWTRRSRQRRHRGSRSDSPPGLDTPGFRGLYGGLENTEDDVLFDRAARRLWELQEARRNGTSTSNTPEREISLRDERSRYH